MASANRDLFIRLTAAVLGRYARQNGRELREADRTAMAAGLWDVAAERGLPPVLAPRDMGVPAEMTPEEVAPLANRVLAGVQNPEQWANLARQLVKMCFQPEFRKCRDSYRQTEPDGSCRRQELARVRERVSGSHCVDCPYWTGLTPDQHERLLRAAWKGDPAELTANRGIFLPEDFRVLRRFVRELARTQAMP